jgi:hypothetical protein
VTLAVGATIAGAQLYGPALARADVVTTSQNVSRDGWDSSEPGLSPATVSATNFGQVFDTKVNGQVYAQPLNVGSSVLVATENDWVYSINRNTGAVNWSTQLGSPYAATAENCADAPGLKPYVGVTSTPVYDPATATLYVSALISGPPGDDTDMSTATPHYALFAVNEATGAINWSKTIAGTSTNGGKAFGTNELQRAGLLLLNGMAYMGFGSLCEDGSHSYDGFIAGVSTQSQAETLWTSEAGDSGFGGIWQGGGGLVSDGTSIYISTGNGGVPPAGTAGSSVSSASNLGQSVVKVTPQGNGTLKAADFFSPGNADQLNPNDFDLGSGGPAILPFTTKNYPQGLIVVAGKDARVFLLSAASLGGRSSSETGSTAVFTGSPSLVNDPAGSTAHGLWGHMAAFAGIGANGTPTDYIYYAGAGWNSTDNMYALKFDSTNPAAPVLTNAGATSQAFGFSSGSPVITSNGTAATSAVVWEVHADNGNGTNGSIGAYSALPAATGVLQQLWSAPIGNAAEFSVAAASSGRVYVGARNDGTAATTGTNATTCPTDFESKTYTSTDSACVGHVHGYGVLSGQLSAATTISMGQVALGQSASKTVTLTNTGDTPVKITKVTSPVVPFGTPSLPALNQPIAAGASVSFPATFTPQATGTSTGNYVVTTTDGFTTRTVTIAVSGAGAAPAAGVTAVPSPGGGWTLNGTALMTATSLQLTPSSHNAAGSAVFYQPLASNGLRVTFRAALSGSTGGDGMSFALVSPGDTTSALGGNGSLLGFGGLHGIAVVLGTHQDPGFPSANFAGIATGTTGSGSSARLALHNTVTGIPNLRSGTHLVGITVSGTGTTRTITVGIDGKQYIKAAFAMPATVLPVFTAGTGATTAQTSLVSAVALSSTATGTLPAPGGGWSYNGSAAMAGAATTLTKAGVTNAAGSVVFPRAVSPASFSATFNMAMGGGNGGDGMTLALLSPGTTATAVGTNGQGEGFAGLNGLAVVLGSTKIPGAPSADFAGIETSTAGSAPSFVATKDLSGAISLRSGTHIVTVSVKAGTLTVTIDGTTVLTHAVTLPASAYVAFTGSTGALTDRHLVQNAAISAG